MRLLGYGLVLIATLMAEIHATEPPNASKNPAQRFLVGFAQDTLDNDWRSAQVHELEQAFRAHPEVRFIYTNAQGQTAQQVQDIEDLAAQGVDVLITSPRDGIVMAPAISSIYRRGIPVVLLTRRIPSDDFSSFIAPDDHALGARAAEVLAQHLKGKGRVLMLQGVPTATTAMQRTKGFESALKKYPQMQIAASLVGNYLRADALNQVEQAILEGIAFDAIYAHSDSMASGARLALGAAGIEPGSIPIVGIDYISEAREAIRRGEQLASFTYPTCAKEAVQQVLQLLHGKPADHQVRVDSIMVTKDNVEQVEPIF